MRVQSNNPAIDDEEEENNVSAMSQQEPFSLAQENEISQDVTPEEIPDIRRLGALQSIQNVPGISNAESANIEATPSAPPALDEYQPEQDFNLPQYEEDYNEAAVTPEAPVQEVPAAEEPGFFSKFGSALKNFYSVPQTPEEFIAQSPVAREQQELVQNAPPAAPDLDFYRNSPVALKNAPESIRQAIKEDDARKVAEFNANLERVRESGEPDIIQGELEALKLDPLATARFEEVTGLPFDDELQQNLQPYVDVYTGSIDALDAEKKSIADRIAGGVTSMTDEDKLMLGLAVLIPIILAGAIGGKEAALGAISGGLQGLSEVLKSNMPTKDEKGLKRLSDIEQEKLALKDKLDKRYEETEKEFKKENVGIDGKRLPEKLKGRETLTFVNPKTGKEETGIRAGNDLLWYDAKNIHSGDAENDIKAMNKLSEDAIERMKTVDQIDEDVSALTDIYDQLEKKGFSSLAPSLAGKYVPGFQNVLSTTVIDPTTGAETNAAALVASIRENALEKYRSTLGGNRTLTDAMIKHFNKILPNPFDADNLLSTEEAKNISKGFKERSTEKLVEGLVSEGFLREPLEQALLKGIKIDRLNTRQSNKDKRESKQATKAIRENIKDARSYNDFEVEID